MKDFFKIIKNINFFDLFELFRYYKDTRVDVLFYSSHPVDEDWIISTKEACKKNGISYATIRNSHYKDIYKDSEERFYYSGKNGALFFLTKIFITSSSGLYRRLMPILCSKRVHMPHSLVSLHMIFPQDAFENFNILFCSGLHHHQEFLALHKYENVSTYNIGYGKMDVLQKEYKDYKKSSSKNKHILIAPSWAKENIIDSISLSLIPKLLDSNYRITIRPHPIFLIEKREILSILENKYKDNALFDIENPLKGNQAIFNADLIISDYSGIAFEYIFLREKPALFIDVAKKVINSQYMEIGLEPIEISLRKSLGIVCMADVKSIIESIDYLLENQESYKDNIVKLRQEYLYNYLECAPHALATIKKLIKES